MWRIPKFQRSNLCPLQWKLRVLTTGQPGNSLKGCSFFMSDVCTLLTKRSNITNITESGTNGPHLSHDTMNWGHSITHLTFLPKTYSMNPITGKQWVKFNFSKHPSKQLGLTALKCQYWEMKQLSNLMSKLTTKYNAWSWVTLDQKWNLFMHTYREEDIKKNHKKKIWQNLNNQWILVKDNHLFNYFLQLFCRVESLSKQKL